MHIFSANVQPHSPQLSLKINNDFLDCPYNWKIKKGFLMKPIVAQRLEKTGREKFSALPASVKEACLRHLRRALRDLPDSPAKRLLQKAFDCCPADSLLVFMDLATIARAEKTPFDGAAARSLRDHNGNPIFTAICEELQAKQAESAAEQCPSTQTNYTRRLFLKTGIIAALTATLSGEMAGGWRKKTEEGSDRLNIGKIVRVTAEAAGVGGAGYSALKDVLRDYMQSVVETINPLVEQEMQKAPETAQWQHRRYGSDGAAPAR